MGSDTVKAPDPVNRSLKMKRKPEHKKLKGQPLMIYVTVEMRNLIQRKSNLDNCTLSEAARRLIKKGLDYEL